MQQQMADEPVVVINFEPVKLGNNVEDKTRGTICKGKCNSSQIDLRLLKRYRKMRRGEVKPKYKLNWGGLSKSEDNCLWKRTRNLQVGGDEPS